ncbi:hypothetical protein [Streptomyces griseosporeus]
MTHTPATEPTTPAAETGVEVSVVDLVNAGRNMCAGEYISGLLSAGQLGSAGTPQALLRDLWPDVDPVVVQEIYNRGCATGWLGAQLYAAPVLRGAQLAGLQEQLAAAGFEAMQGMVSRSRRLVAGAHPADSDMGREH